MLKPVIISPFGFLEVEMEGVFWNALKLRQTHLGQPPEAFDAVDVGRALGELVLRVIDAEVTIPNIHKSVITPPTIRVDDGTNIDFTPDNPL